MILKKPYAFLIKYFKIIHLIIFILTLYINTYYSKISNFFKVYSSNHYYEANIAKTYIPTLSFIFIILLLGLFTIMIYLMNQKKKPTKLYVFSIIYYLIILIAMFIAYNKMNTLYEITMEQRASRLYRDIYLILNIPSYYFMFMYLIRAIGFDIKKFNFKKDLEELEINTEDNEEFEFVLGKDDYIYKRKIHRLYREIIYFYKENKFILNIVFTVFIGIILVIILLNLSINIHKYHIGTQVNSTQFTFKLNNAYITSYDYRDEIISENKRYILLDMTITNKNAYELKAENIYLLYNNKQQSLIKTSLSNSFSDIGKVYKGDIIPNQPTDIILVYEVPANIKISKTSLMVYTGTKQKNDKTEYQFDEYKFSLIDLDKNNNQTSITLNEKYQLGTNTIYGNTTFTIKNIELHDKYEYTYQKCTTENICQTLTDVIIADNRNANQILVVDYEMEIDEQSLLAQSVKSSPSEILNKFAKISFTQNEKNTTQKIYGQEKDKLENKIFFEVPKTITSTDETKALIIKTRENEYKLSF